ncbi:MAG: serine/threonine-protein kinase, partial [Myxococcota bacterium]
MEHSVIRTLEKYELLEEIGLGGMATVYRAWDTLLQREVAVKVLHPHLRSASEARQRFTREARSVARLKHSNILEIYDYSGEESDESFIVAELLTGPTLSVFSEQHPKLPAEVAASFTIEVLAALEVAHDNGVIHRDVKPENVLLHEQRGLKLTDFGIAQIADAHSMTSTGQILGSPGYMAPEQIEGRACDIRTDLFSTGTLLYFLGVGALPFSARNPHAVLKKIAEVEFADPLRVRPTIGVELRDIILKALSKEPADRYQNAAEFRRALEEFVFRCGVPDTSRLLRDYLDRPQQVSSNLRERIIRTYTELGDREISNKKLASALNYYDRVLSLDEGNPHVLARVSRVSRRRSWRNWRLKIALAALLGSGFGVLVLSVPRHAVPPSEPVRRSARLSQVDKDHAADATQEPVRSATRSEETPPRSSSKSPSVRQVKPSTSRYRLVRFVPRPSNVMIGWNGENPRAFGPDWRETSLSIGRHHSVTVRPNGLEAYSTLSRKVYVSAGDGPLFVPLALPLKNARLYVIRNVSSAVQVQDGPVGAPDTSGFLQV